MYRVELFRTGIKWNSFNCGALGSFYKEFNTLSEIAKYLHDSKGGLLLVNARKDLTNTEYNIFFKKLRSLNLKNNLT